MEYCKFILFFLFLTLVLATSAISVCANDSQMNPENRSEYNIDDKIFKEIIVYETDTIKLRLSTYDADGDKLTYTFSPPLNKKGEWKTNYGDAGEYIVNVTVSDGENTIMKKVKIIVLPRNRPPKVVIPDEVVVFEGDLIEIEPEVYDYEDDSIIISATLPLGDDLKWQTTYDDAGVYDVEILFSDGENVVKKNVKIIVQDKNRLPEFTVVEPEDDAISIKEGENISFYVDAFDPDLDELSFLWFVDEKKVSEGKNFVLSTGFKDEGKKTVEVVVNDGKNIVQKKWRISVKDVNRKPTLKVSPEKLKVKEGDLVKLTVKAFDPDDDPLEIDIEEPFDKNFEWQTDYDDAGNYTIMIKVSDGKDSVKKFVHIEVEDVNRKPVFKDVPKLNVVEGGLVTLDLNAYVSDPDGDEITLHAEKLPDGAEFINGILIYKPGFDTIVHGGGLLGWKNKTQKKIVVYASDGKDKTKKRIYVDVFDKNRPPTIESIDDIWIKEGDEVRIKPKVSDPDDDELKITFSTPLDENGIWQTDYDDAGTYLVRITVSDGIDSTSLQFNISVENVNRPPEIELPEKFEISENETLKIDFASSISDPDGDRLEILIKNLPENATFANNTFEWMPSFDFVQDAELRNAALDFVVSDGKKLSDSGIVIKVKNKNRPPKIEKALQSAKTVFVGDGVYFKIIASDPDGDELLYKWKFGLLDAVEGANMLRRTFTSSGNKLIKAIVCDRESCTEQSFSVSVVG